MKRNINQFGFFHPAYHCCGHLAPNYGPPPVSVCTMTPQRQRRRSSSLQLAKKKQRDNTRMAAFMNKKDAQNLPFFEVENARLQELSYNSLLRMNNCQSTYKALRRKNYQCHRYEHYDSEGESDAESEDSFVSAVSVTTSQRLAELHGDLEDSKRQISSLKEDNVNLGAQCQSLKVTNQQLKEDLQALEVTKAELNTRSEENSQLKNQCADLKLKIHELDCVSLKLKSENSKVQKECADLKSKIQDSECVATKLRSENSKIKKECADLKSENKNLQKCSLQLKNEKSEVSKIKSENVKLKRENVDLKSQIKHVKKQSSQLQKENSDVKTKCAKLENENKQYAEQVAQLKSSVAEAEHRANVLDEDMGCLFRTYENLKDTNLAYEELTMYLRREFQWLAIQMPRSPDQITPCQMCGTYHRALGCTAKYWNCYGCGLKGHFAAVCTTTPLVREPEVEFCDDLLNIFEMKYSAYN